MAPAKPAVQRGRAGGAANAACRTCPAASRCPLDAPPMTHLPGRLTLPACLPQASPWRAAQCGPALCSSSPLPSTSPRVRPVWALGQGLLPPLGVWLHSLPCLPAGPPRPPSNAQACSLAAGCESHTDAHTVALCSGASGGAHAEGGIRRQVCALRVSHPVCSSMLLSFEALSVLRSASVWQAHAPCVRRSLCCCQVSVLWSSWLQPALLLSWGTLLKRRRPAPMRHAGSACRALRGRSSRCCCWSACCSGATSRGRCPSMRPRPFRAGQRSGALHVAAPPCCVPGLAAGKHVSAPAA